MSSIRLPRLFLAAIGNERDGYYQVRWEGGELAWSFGGETVRLVPDEQAWRLFWRAVEMNGVWDWRERYERHVDDDGTYWVVELDTPGRTLSSSGVNAFPPGPRGSASPTREFNRFCAAVSRLAGGRDFGSPRMHEDVARSRHRADAKGLSRGQSQRVPRRTGRRRMG